MPDAGFTDQSPRWDWWHDTEPRTLARAVLSQHSPGEGREVPAVCTCKYIYPPRHQSDEGHWDRDPDCPVHGSVGKGQEEARAWLCPNCLTPTKDPPNYSCLACGALPVEFAPVADQVGQEPEPAGERVTLWRTIFEAGGIYGLWRECPIPFDTKDRPVEVREAVLSPPVVEEQGK